MDPKLLRADELGIRLEIVRGLPIYNPYTSVVLHVRADGVAHHLSPVELTFACGCGCKV